METSARDTTRLLAEWGKGDPHALQELMPLVYDELRRLAGHLLKREPAGHTLQPTALVHEAYLRMVDQKRVDWQNRAHFLAVAAQMLRRVLVDHARAKQRLKRSSGTVILSFDESLASGPERNLDIMALDEALSELARIDPQQSRIVELRFFAGLSIEETAASLAISPATVKRDWTVARAWLYRQLAQS